MNKAYDKIVWKNKPSTATPLNQTNLNKMSDALDTIDDRVIALDSGKVSSVTVTNTLPTGDTIATITVDGTATNIKSAQITVDSEISTTSTNPVQNKVIAEALREVMPEVTVEGNPISITDGSNIVPAKLAEVTFLPKQSGSGEPSPQNVRPISGWTEVNLTRTGKNLAKTLGLTFANPSSTTYSNATPRTFTANSYFWGLTYNNYFNSAQISNNTYSNGVFEFKSDAIAYGANIPIIGLLVGETYTISAESTNGVINVSFYDKSGNYISNVNTARFTVPENTYYTIICLRVNANGATATFKNIQIELGSTATTYEPYNGQTYTESLGATYYGGKVDFVSGEGLEEWDYIASYDGETLPGEWISDRDVYAPGTTPTTGAEVAYKLSEAVELTLTPQEIALLKGQNVLITDGDNIILKYSADIKAWVESQLSNS